MVLSLAACGSKEPSISAADKLNKLPAQQEKQETPEKTEKPEQPEAPAEKAPAQSKPNKEKPGKTDKTEPEESDKENSGSEETEKPENTTRPGTSRPGLTVTVPTKEEIMQHATDNGLKPLELSDGTLFASFVDFSDYFYYNMSTIVSILSALVVAIIVLMIYFHGITVKISRLADDVSGVYERDMNSEIRTLRGKDEISELTRNVEQMRCSMLEGLKKEREALDANSELITSMSHDIRTPLTVLLGYLDIMKSYPVDSELSEHIKAAENTALRLKDFSDDMFRYFLVFGGKELEVTLGEYDAHTLFEQMLSEHLLLLRERGFILDTDFTTLQTSGVAVTTDAPKLMRVVDNIFSNIYKYADASYPVRFSAELSGGVLKITVQNTVKSVSEAESNGVGLRTCSKICEALDVRFEYGESDKDGIKIFVSTLEFKVEAGKKHSGD
jgi:signal transduction histidine kinase